MRIFRKWILKYVREEIDAMAATKDAEWRHTFWYRLGEDRVEHKEYLDEWIADFEKRQSVNYAAMVDLVVAMKQPKVED